MPEKNRHTLIQVLQQLKIYQPPAKIWGNVVELLSGQKRAQAKLPELPLKKAPPHVWEQLNDALDYGQDEVNREILRENVEKLPLHRPPINHWYNIEVGLDQHDRRKIYQKRKYLFSSAATILLLGIVFSAFLWLSFEFIPQNQMPVAEQAMPESSRLEEGELVFSREGLLQLLEEELLGINLRQDTIQTGKVPANIQPGIDLSFYFEDIPLENQDEELTELKNDLKILNVKLQKFVHADSISINSQVLEHFTAIEKERAEIIKSIIEKL